MAKTNNKGFSLIEIVIAIAILTLLLTPIVSQLSNTMKVNRKAKEQQYENENAQYTLEYFQSTSLKNIATSSSANPDNYVTQTAKFDGKVNPKLDCLVFSYDGMAVAPLTDASGNDVSVAYSATEYEMNSVKLGSKQTEYNRTVVVDDLSNKIQELKVNGKSYRVVYNIDNEMVKAMLTGLGFEQDDEGCWKMYGAVADAVSGGTYSYVNAIVCRPVTENDITDPNEVNIGNVHNLDATKHALINGYTTSYDAQVYNDFYSAVMNCLENSDNANARKRWEIEMANPGRYLTPARLFSGVKKLTEIKLAYEDINVTMDGPFYTVSVVSTYENKIDLGAEGSYFVSKSYTVYTQTFLEKDNPTVPEVFFEYQPLALDTTSNSVDYITEDYILIDNQAGDAKIYFYKPAWDAAMQKFYPGVVTSAANDTSSSDAFWAIKDAKQIAEDNDYVYNSYYIYNDWDDQERSTTAENRRRVSIKLALTTDPNAAANYKPVTVYTNLDILPANLTLDNGVTVDNSQFSLNDTAVYANWFKTSGNVATATDAVVTTVSRTVYPFPSSALKLISDEANNKDRLYTITVNVSPASPDTLANTVVLTGAKGGN